MTDTTLTIKAGILPYSDGSGYKVTVTIEQNELSVAPTISIESFRLPVTEWPAVVESVNRLLRALPTSPETGGGGM